MRIKYHTRRVVCEVEKVMELLNLLPSSIGAIQLATITSQKGPQLYWIGWINSVK